MKLKSEPTEPTIEEANRLIQNAESPHAQAGDYFNAAKYLIDHSGAFTNLTGGYRKSFPGIFNENYLRNSPISCKFFNIGKLEEADSIIKDKYINSYSYIYSYHDKKLYYIEKKENKELGLLEIKIRNEKHFEKHRCKNYPYYKYNLDANEIYEFIIQNTNHIPKINLQFCKAIERYLVKATQNLNYKNRAIFYIAQFYFCFYRNVPDVHQFIIKKLHEINFKELNNPNLLKEEKQALKASALMLFQLYKKTDLIKAFGYYYIYQNISSNNTFDLEKFFKKEDCSLEAQYKIIRFLVSDNIGMISLEKAITYYTKLLYESWKQPISTDSDMNLESLLSLNHQVSSKFELKILNQLFILTNHLKKTKESFHIAKMIKNHTQSGTHKRNRVDYFLDKDTPYQLAKRASMKTLFSKLYFAALLPNIFKYIGMGIGNIVDIVLFPIALIKIGLETTQTFYDYLNSGFGWVFSKLFQGIGIALNAILITPFLPILLPIAAYQSRKKNAETVYINLHDDKAIVNRERNFGENNHPKKSKNLFKNHEKMFDLLNKENTTKQDSQNIINSDHESSAQKLVHTQEHDSFDYTTLSIFNKQKEMCWFHIGNKEESVEEQINLLR